MSYATSLLMSYPSPYGPSPLVSDEFVQRSSLGTFYGPTLSYMSGRRLASDTFAYNRLGLGPTIYRPSAYLHFPIDYRISSIPDWQRDIPGQISYGSLNNVREYSESLGTASNVGTASSIARSIDETSYNASMKIFPDYQSSYNRLLNDVDRTIWRPPTRSKSSMNDEKPIRSKSSTNDEKLTSTNRSLPELSAPVVRKESPIEELKKDTAPIPSSPPASSSRPVSIKQESKSTLIENEKRKPSVDVQKWLNKTPKDEKQQPTVDVKTRLNEPKIESSKDEKSDEQAWIVKIDKLHTIQARREKERTKLSHPLPNPTNNFDNKPHITSLQRKNESYFDTIFDGNYFRKTSINQQNFNSSYQRNKPITNSPPNKPKTTISPKHVSPRKVPQYEPPSINRVPTIVTTTSWKTQVPKQKSITARENIQKEEDERFREALHKFRSDRAEQQQRDSNKSTAKRLHYGDYVRRSTKSDLLHSAIKPLPWSDFLDMKKGNIYSLSKEEKKDLYKQARLYGERVRYRNFTTLHHGDETNRSTHRSTVLSVQNGEPQSGDETSHETTNEDDEFISDFELSRKQKKKLYDAAVQTDESENEETSDHRSTRMRHRDTDDDLSTVREEKTFKTSRDARNKKR